jgi:WD40 repeat protein
LLLKLPLLQQHREFPMLGKTKKNHSATTTLALIIAFSCISKISIAYAEKVITEYQKCPVFKNSICISAIHPNNLFIATGKSTDNVEIWQIDNGNNIFSLPHLGGVPSVAFSPDGQLIATGGYDSEIMIWQVLDGKLLKTLSGHKNMIFKIVFSPDSKMLASVGADDNAILWDVATGESHVLSAHDGDVWGVAFSPDGKQLLTGGEDNVINIWDVSSSKLVKKLTEHSGAVLELAFSHDGKRIASGGDDYTIKIWDTANWSVIKTLEDDSYSIYGLTFNPDDSILISGGRDKGLFGEFLQYHWQYKSSENNVTIRMWDVKKGSVIKRLNNHSDDVTNVNLTSDGKQLISSGPDGKVVIQELDL